MIRAVLSSGVERTCTDIKKVKHLDGVLGKMGGIKLDKICDILGVKGSTCIQLENRNNLDAYHIAQAYIDQRAQSCWEDIIRHLCSDFDKGRLAKEVAEEHNVAFSKYC